MQIFDKDYTITFDLLLEHLDRLPHPERTVETLKLASILIEDAAYNHAQYQSGDDVVQMILLSSEVSKVSERHAKD